MSKKTVIVTGGTTGIGQATALKFAKEGYNVVVTSRKLEKEAQTHQYFQDHGVDVTFMELDVTNEEQFKKVVDETVKKFGQLNVMVNNAGMSIGAAPLADTDSENFVKIFNTNVMGVYYGMKYAIKAMLKTGGGQIVNVASALGLRGVQNGAFYSATKHAVIGLTKSAALDYATKGIRINAVAPGGIKTDIFKAGIEAGRYTEESIAAMHPMKKMGEPWDIALAIYFLASDENSFLTGATLSVDGGLGAL